MQSLRLSKKMILALAAAAVAGSLVPASLSRAATITWNGAASDGLWATGGVGGNWSNSNAPVTVDTALFNSTGSTISLGGAARSLTSFSFDTSVGSFTFNTGGSGGQFNLASGGNIALPTTATGTNLTQTFNAPIVLLPASATTAGTYTFNNSAGVTNSLVFNGAISGGTTTGTITLNLSGSNPAANTGNILGGVISDGSAAGGLAINKANVATWTITGTTNSFSGAVTVNQGTLALQTIANAGSNSSIGRGTAINLNGASAGSATLQILGAGGTTDRTITIVNNGANGGIINSSGSGPVIFNGAITTTNAAAAGTLTLAGSNSGTNEVHGTISNSPDGTKVMTVTKTGVGNWLLSGTNTYTGATTVSGGVLLINGNDSAATGAVAVNAGGTLGGTGSVGGAVTVVGNATAASRGTIDLTSNGIGTLSLVNAATSLTLGGTTNGTLSNLRFDLSTATNDQISATGAVNLQLGGAQIAITEAATRIAANQRTLLTFGSRAGSGAFSLASASGSGTRTYALSADSTHEYVNVTGGLAVAGITLAAPSRALAGSTVGVTGTVTNSAIGGNNDLLVGLTSAGTTTVGALTPLASTVNAGANTTYSGSFTAGAGGTTASLAVTETDSGGSAYYTGPATSTTASVAIVSQRTYTNPSTINLGIVHAGQTVSSATSVTSNGGNFGTVANAALGAYAGSVSNGLTLSGASTLFNGNTSGTLSSARTISGTVTGSAGTISGSFGLSSTDEFGTVVSNAASVAYSGQINNYASPVYAASGLTHSGTDTVNLTTPTSYTLNLGSFTSGTGPHVAGLSLANHQLDAVYQDMLNGSFTIYSGSGFTLSSGFNIGGSIAALSSTSSPLGLNVDFATPNATSSYTEVLKFAPTSSNTSGNTSLNDIFLTLTGSITGSAKFDITNSPITLNVLKGGALPTAVTVNAKNDGSAPGAVSNLALTPADANLNLTQATGGSITVGSTDSTGSVGLVSTASYVSGSSTLSAAPDGTGTTVSVSYDVGKATADNTNSRTSFGPALTASVTAGSNAYAGLSSKTAAVSGSGGTDLGGEAVIFKGDASANTTVGEAWRTVTSSDIGPLFSDVVELSGLGTDTVVLAVYYNAAGLTTAQENALFLGREISNSGLWANAGNNAFTKLGAWTNQFTVGQYGLDTIHHDVWAVVTLSSTSANNNFAVIPEPASLGLLAVGATALLVRRRKN